MPGVRGVSAPLAFVTLLQCAAIAAQQPCFTGSDVGPVIRLGSSVTVYCVFMQPCRKLMFVDRKPMFDAREHNSTSIAVRVSEIWQNHTYTCTCHSSSEPCGMDLLVGHPPDVPYELKCIQKGEFGKITCTWRSGRETYIGTLLELWVKVHGDSGAATPVSFRGSGSVTFPIFGLQSLYSVWVNASNKLGTAVSETLNFTLNEIVKPEPPNIMRVHCFSQQCVLYWSNETSAQLLQVQHRPQNGNWTTHFFMVNKHRNYSISGLQPFTVYEFQARCKLSPNRGLWSEWSSSRSNRTDEEAPLTNLDVWYIEKSAGSQEKLIVVLWKELSESEARGRILGYEITVEDTVGGTVREFTMNSSTGLSVTCSSCNITVFAYNTKGYTPPARLVVSQQRAQPPRNVVCQPLSNHSIAIFWKEPATAEKVKGYLVEWQPVKGSMQGLQWKRIPPDHCSTVITENIQPFRCYKVAVHALYEQVTGRANFTEAYSWQSAPSLGPTPSLEVNGNSVTVTWSRIPREHQRGCLESYTIYITNAAKITTQHGPIGVSERRYTINGLLFGEHSLFVTGRTAMGESPPGDRRFFFISLQKNDHKRAFKVFIVSCFLCLGLLVLGCLCQASTVRHRVSACCYCLLADAVPDPANSRWAKECKTHKGQMVLAHNLDVNDSTLSGEEPETLEIQEQDIWEASLGKLAGCNGTLTGSTTFSPSVKNSRTGFQDPTAYPAHPVCPYIKSFSQESDSSERTEESKSTDVTSDYISSHGLLEDDSGELEQDHTDDFIPSFPSPFPGHLVPVEGNLTLDTVKIEWGDLD